MYQIIVIFSSKSERNTANLLASISRTNACGKSFLKDYNLSIFLIDKTEGQKLEDFALQIELPIRVLSLREIMLLEKKYVIFFELANCSFAVDSIQRTRIQQQIFILDNFESFNNSIVWQVDDDMLFAESNFQSNQHSAIYGTNYFSELIKIYNGAVGVDCIIAPSTYTPPIPSLLYSRTQLRNLFYNKFKPNQKIEATEYHDYHTTDSINKEYGLFLSETTQKDLLVKEILLGRAVTAASVNNENDSGYLFPSRLLRGGNFIVFNMDIFKCPHLGFTEESGMPARRSDMIHANLLVEMGFIIKDTNSLSLIHNWDLNANTMQGCIEKYYSDMIGALLIQYLYKSESEFKNRLNFYREHIGDIIDVITENLKFNMLKEELESLQSLNDKILLIQESSLIQEFDKFKTIKSKIIETLCNN